MNTDTLGNAGPCRCQANQPVELARTDVLPAVAGKQPGLAGSHPSRLARHVPQVAQQLKKVGRENDIPVLLASRLREGRLLPSSTRMNHSVAVDVGELQRPQAGGISQAQGLVLDVRR